MRKALQRAAHVLVAAGALCSARPAVAQTADSSSKVPASNSQAGVVRTGFRKPHNAEPIPPSQEKLEELQVELALLSNPATFPYSLGAKRTDANLEVRGYVPSTLIKDQAIEIARKHCSVPVVDKLQLHPTLTLRSPAGPSDELQEGAATLLVESFGAAVVGLEIKTAADGQVVLEGSCESYEQKVEISKKMRGLHGCCSVDNRLTVNPVMRDGRMVTLVTADGSYTLPAGGVPSTPIQTVHNSAENSPPLTPLSVPPPVIAAAPIPPYKNEFTPLAPVQPPAQPSLKMDARSSVVMKTDVPPAPAFKPEPPPLSPPSMVLKTDPLPAPAFKPVPPPSPPSVVLKIDPLPVLPPLKAEASASVTLKTDAPPPFKLGDPLPPPPVIKPKPLPVAPPAPSLVMKTDMPPASDRNQQMQAQVLPPLKPDTLPPLTFKPVPPVAAPVAPATSPLTNVPAYAKTTASLPPIVQTKATDIVSSPLPAVPAMPVKTATPPNGGQWPPAHESRPPQAAYSTRGVVMFDEDLPEPPPVLGHDKTALLKQKVAAVCGNRAKEVIVETKSDGIMHVTVKTVSPTENIDLTDKILVLPEMASPNVKLEYQLAP
jgi:hypothetical protein